MEETETTVVTEEWYNQRDWRIVLLLAVLALLALFICCSITRCLGGQGIPQPPFSSGRLDCPEPEAARAKVSIPASLSPTEAVLIGRTYDVDKDHDGVDFYIYDDPEDPEWNILAESGSMATRLSWIGIDNAWHTAYPVNDFPERGTKNHNVMFLIPPGMIGGNTQVAVVTIPAPSPPIGRRF